MDIINKDIEYNIGDEITIRKDLEVCDYQSVVIDEMLKYRGRVFEIVGKNRTVEGYLYYYLGTISGYINYKWNSYMFEPAKNIKVKLI